jgi:hypothetical protein
LVNVKTMPRGEWVRLNEQLVDGDTWLIDGSLVHGHVKVPTGGQEKYPVVAM